MPTPQELLEKQARVYGVLDIVTKPIQWFIGGLKVLGFLLLAALVAIFTPVYHLVTTGTASAIEIEIALFVIGLFILFFSAPWYTVIGGIALLATTFFYAVFNPDASAPSYELVEKVLWGFQLVGYLWVAVEHYRKRGVRGDSAKRQKRTDAGRVHTSRPQRHSAPKRDRREITRPGVAPDDYQVLGLHNGATREDIKQAYRDLVKVWHPDRFSADDERLRRKAETQLKQINEAYAHLTSSASPGRDVNEMDLDDAIQYVTAIMRNANGEFQDLNRRFNAGEFAERADALRATERIIASLEGISANFNDVVERIKRDAPDAAANANFVQSQKNMKQLAGIIHQMKELLGCQ